MIASTFIFHIVVTVNPSSSNNVYFFDEKNKYENLVSGIRSKSRPMTSYALPSVEKSPRG